MTRVLLQFPQISERTTVPESTLRYWRHMGGGPPMFRLGRRLVAFEDELDAWIADQQTAADAARRSA